MKIFNLSKDIFEYNLDKYNSSESYFIVTTPNEFLDIRETLDMHVSENTGQGNLSKNIHFENYPDYDYLSFIYFEIENGKFNFETIKLYFSKKVLILVIPDGINLYKETLHRYDLDDLVFIYYDFLNNAFVNMLEAMYDYESVLSKISDDILNKKEDFEFERIVEIKNDCYKIKKYLNFLQFIGDQILVNRNNLIPQNSMIYFKNIDIQINRMYKYAANMFEASEHLLELYNSAVNSRTNDSISKLTIVTVFATPITILTGVYGMNFVNMPELRHEYGYFIFLGSIVIIILLVYLILRKIKLL